VTISQNRSFASLQAAIGSSQESAPTRSPARPLRGRRRHSHHVAQDERRALAPLERNLVPEATLAGNRRRQAAGGSGPEERIRPTAFRCGEVTDDDPVLPARCPEVSYPDLL
jgi:hypothetical protein